MSILIRDCVLSRLKCCVLCVQDPNPSDAIEIFILADPGIPEGMVCAFAFVWEAVYYGVDVCACNSCT